MTLQQGCSSSQTTRNPGAIKDPPRQSLLSPTRENPIMFHQMKAPVSRLWLKAQASDHKVPGAIRTCSDQGSCISHDSTEEIIILDQKGFKNREAEGQRGRGWETTNETSDSQHATEGITRGTSRRKAVKHLRHVCLKRHGQCGNFSPLSTAEQNLTWVGPHRKGWGKTAAGFPCNEGTVQRRQGLAGSDNEAQTPHWYWPQPPRVPRPHRTQAKP